MSMDTSGPRRAYGQVRTLIESMGGRMEWRAGGGPGGSWELSLGEYTAVVPLHSVEDDPHNALDQLYVPLVPNPQKITDYPPDPDAHLVDEAPERLVTLLFKKYREQQKG
jgi:hypothetical protein